MNLRMPRSALVQSLVVLLSLGGQPAWADDPGPLAPAPTQVLNQVGTTYPYAQQLQWLDETHFIVGRWDGTLTFFRPPGPGEFGPTLTEALRTPSGQGVQMMAIRDERTFTTSDDATSILVWFRLGLDSLDAEKENGKQLINPYWYRRFTYSADVGVANSGVFMTHGGREYFVSGHENGFVLVWRYDALTRGLQLLKKVNVRSPNPIPSPFPLWNVRDIVAWRDGLVVTGSEDGDLTLFKVPEGTVVARMRYNPGAQRGINGLAVLDDRLVAVACSVGPSDKNTWLFRLQPAGFQPLGSVDLKKDTTLPQSFAFRVAMVRVGGQDYAFASTQEGLLWTVLVTPDGQLQIVSDTSTDFPIGDTIDYQPQTSSLAVVGILINLFNVGAAGASPAMAPAPPPPAPARVPPPRRSQGTLREVPR